MANVLHVILLGLAMAATAQQAVIFRPVSKELKSSEESLQDTPLHFIPGASAFSKYGVHKENKGNQEDTVDRDLTSMHRLVQPILHLRAHGAKLLRARRAAPSMTTSKIVFPSFPEDAANLSHEMRSRRAAPSMKTSKIVYPNFPDAVGNLSHEWKPTPQDDELEQDEELDQEDELGQDEELDQEDELEQDEENAADDENEQDDDEPQDEESGQDEEQPEDEEQLKDEKQPQVEDNTDSPKDIALETTPEANSVDNDDGEDEKQESSTTEDPGMSDERILEEFESLPPIQYLALTPVERDAIAEALTNRLENLLGQLASADPNLAFYQPQLL